MELMNDVENGNNDPRNYRINSNRIITSKYFEYKAKIIGSAQDNNSRLDAEGVTPKKYMSSFSGSFNLP